MLTKEMCNYLEELRKQRKIEQNDFCDNVVSVRQYKRYLSGDSEMPYNVFILLCDKLGFNPTKVQGDIDMKHINQHQFVEDIYNSVVRNDFEKVDRLLEENDVDSFYDENLRKYFDTSILLMRFYREKLDKDLVCKEMKNIMGYDTIIKKDLFDQLELLMLSILLMFICKESDKKILMDKLSAQLLKNRLTSGNEFYSRQYVTLRLCREYGIVGDNEKVIELCLNALEISNRPSIHFNFDFFYYYLALCYRNLNDDEKKIYYIDRLYRYLYFVDDPVKTKKYENKMPKDFGGTFEELLNL